jgi:hypothetical protein
MRIPGGEYVMFLCFRARPRAIDNPFTRGSLPGSTIVLISLFSEVAFLPFSMVFNLRSIADLEAD